MTEQQSERAAEPQNDRLGECESGAVAGQVLNLCLCVCVCVSCAEIPLRSRLRCQLASGLTALPTAAATLRSLLLPFPLAVAV